MLIVEAGAAGRYRVTNLDQETGEVVTDVVDTGEIGDCYWYRFLKRDQDGNLVYNGRGEVRRVRHYGHAVVVDDLGPV